MKKCMSCGNDFENFRNRCPHCGGETSLQSLTAEDALSALDSMKSRSESAQIVDQGAKLFFEGKFDEAEKAFRKAIQIFSQNAPAYGNLGHILLKKGEYEKSISWLEKALELDPHLEGVAEALEEAKGASKGKAKSLTGEEISNLKPHGTKKSGWKNIFKKFKGSGRVKFLEKYSVKQDTMEGPIEFFYEKYEADSVQNAIEFLDDKTVTQNYYYIEFIPQVV